MKEPSGSTIGAWEYYHIVQFTDGGYGYGVTATQEGMANIVGLFKAAGHEVTFSIIGEEEEVSGE